VNVCAVPRLLFWVSLQSFWKSPVDSGQKNRKKADENLRWPSEEWSKQKFVFPNKKAVKG
jgi:hypothetical protein